MGYSRRVRFGDLRSGLPRLEFSSEFVATLVPPRHGDKAAVPPAERGEKPEPGRHARRAQL